MRLAGLGILGVILAAGTSCDADPPASDTLNVRTASRDAGGRGTEKQVSCAGLDECACAQTPGCAPVTTDCWCPPAACGASASSCACEGGRFLGCNPTGAGCGGGHCSLLDEPSLSDDQGCISCVGPSDCAGAGERLASACPAVPPTATEGICDVTSGTTGGDCATFCLAALRTCDGAYCALCVDCDCANDIFLSCMRECLSSAQNHR